VDSAWEQEKLEARKMLENAARREASVPSVQPLALAKHPLRAHTKCDGVHIILAIAKDAVLGG